MKRLESVPIEKEQFFEIFDDPALEEKVEEIRLEMFEDDQGEPVFGLGFQSTQQLTDRDMDKLFRHFQQTYNVPVLLDAFVDFHFLREFAKLKEASKRKHRGDDAR